MKTKKTARAAAFASPTTSYAENVRAAIAAYHEAVRQRDATEADTEAAGEETPNSVYGLVNEAADKLIVAIFGDSWGDASPLSRGFIEGQTLYLATPEDRDAGELGYEGDGSRNSDGTWYRRLVIVPLEAISGLDQECPR